ncbi:MAG: ABC transporter permease [Actinobacteria bacterium]|nr:ABC transporter permease [Actinomycetota bacterium]
MKGFKNALWAEMLKARCSKMPLLSVLVCCIIPVVCGLFMLILKNPDFAKNIGLIGAKAQLAAGSADWPSYLAVIAQATAIAGLMLFSLIAIWLFGREYSDRTLKDILAVPTSRAEIVAAKFTLLVVWSVFLSGLILGLSFIVGAAVDIPKWSQSTAFSATGHIAGCAGLTVLIILPVAFVTCAGRGYLPGFGYTLITLAVGMIFAATGWGVYIPWSIPALYSGAAGSEGGQPGAVGFILVVLTGIIGVAVTFYWWTHADQTR